jgi:hypothetical protein
MSRNYLVFGDIEGKLDVLRPPPDVPAIVRQYAEPDARDQSRDCRAAEIRRIAKDAARGPDLS